MTINEKVLDMFHHLEIEGELSLRIFWHCPTHRLRSCSAEVAEGYTGYFLKSYHTIIAYIPYDGKDCYDFLRYVYGYTATSAQHITKFAHDYGNGKVFSWKGV